jgi:hypothetical protein
MGTPQRGSERFAHRVGVRVPTRYRRNGVIVMAVTALLVPAFAVASTTTAEARAAGLWSLLRPDRGL